ncbi:MAG: hypothetical protein ABR591_05930, partial [Candidatus Velthaea sp.]
MKRLLACVSLIAVTTTAAASSTTPAAKPVPKPAAPPAAKAKLAPKIKVAPADEYFGKLKMSILGIRNTIKDVGANVDIDGNRWTLLVNKADFTEDAVRDWERKYPSDTWLARTIFALERMYAKLDSDEGRKRSVAAMNWLVHDFPNSPQAKIGKKELAAGRVGHPVTQTATAGTTASAAPSALASSV